MFKNGLPVALLLFFSFQIFAEPQPLLVSSKWVQEHLNDPQLVVFHVSTLRLDYETGHIPGARFLWPEWLTPNTPDGNYNVPDAQTATARLQELGISKDSKIVLCYAGNQVSVTARIFLTMEQLGLRGQVSFLDGGFNDWKKAGYPVSTTTPVFKKGNFKVKTGNLIVDKDYVLQSLRSDTTAVVDARMRNFYDRDPTGNPRNGHITGAMNIPYAEMVDSTDHFKSQALLLPYFNPVMTPENREMVVYCFIGQTASVVYLAGRLLGYRVKLYDASLQEWSRRPELPMEETKK